MKKKLMVKLAALMCLITETTSDIMTLAAPNSLFLWGEPTPPKKKK